jgi:hypothetical protein
LLASNEINAKGENKMFQEDKDNFFAGSTTTADINANTESDNWVDDLFFLSLV